MDPVAHTLVGATLAEAGLKRQTALAAGTLIIGVNLPDIDAIAMFAGSDYSLLVRRGWTHGIFALLIWPFLLTGFMLLYDRLYRRKSRFPDRRGDTQRRESGSLPVRKGQLLGIAFLAVWSHPFLDWLNTYGIRLLMPFDDTWFYGDTLFIVDPWLWLLMAAAVVLARSKSLYSVTGWLIFGAAATALITGTARVQTAVTFFWCTGVALIILIRMQGWFRGKIDKVARGCLTAFGLYLIFMFTGSQLAVLQARKQLSGQGIEARRVMANPRPARLLLRNGVAASDTHYYRFEVNWMKSSGFRFTGDPIPVMEPDRIVKAALRSPEIEGFQNWMRFPVYEVRPLEPGCRVIIRDLRYVAPDQEENSGIGMAVVDLEQEGCLSGMTD